MPHLCSGVSQRGLPWLLVLSFLWRDTVLSKVVTGETTLQPQNNWVYLTKFSYSLGSGNFTFNIGPTADAAFIEGARFFLYLDEDWEQAVNAPTCEEKLSYAKWQSATLRTRGPPLRHAVSQSIRPHFWYFVVADCRSDVAASSIRYKLEMFNADGSHFSHEELAPSRMLPVLTITYILSLVPLAILLHSYVSRLRGHDIHPSIVNLGLALLLVLVSLCLDSFNYWVYAENGTGVRAADIGAELANWLAQLVISLELLSIAWVWSIDTVLSPTRKRRVGRYLLAQFVTLLVILHVIFIIFGRHYDDAHSKYHESETPWALGLIVMRLALGSLFAGGIHNLLVRECSYLQKSFLLKLAAWGGVYFLSMPSVITVASTLFASYLRHQVVTVGSAAVQIFSLIGLSVLLLTRNDYTELASLSSCSLPSIKYA